MESQLKILDSLLNSPNSLNKAKKVVDSGDNCLYLYHFKLFSSIKIKIKKYL